MDINAIREKLIVLQLENSLDYLLELKLKEPSAEVIEGLVRCYGKIHDLVSLLPSEGSKPKAFDR